MNVDAITAAATTLGDVARAHESLNAAYGAIAADRAPATLPRDVDLARGYVHEARTILVDMRADYARHLDR